MIKRILEKISWKTRRLNVGFSILSMSIGNDHHGCNIRLFEIAIGLRTYALFALEFRLPNKTTVRDFTIDHWDFLFLHYPLYWKWDDLSERKLWSRNLSAWEETQLSILQKLF